MSGESKELVRLVAIPRGRDETEELRVSLDEFEPDNGKPSRYVSARIWFKGERGDWLPTKKGITVRVRELDAVIGALEKARKAITSGKLPGTEKQAEPECNVQDEDLF